MTPAHDPDEITEAPDLAEIALARPRPTQRAAVAVASPAVLCALDAFALPGGCLLGQAASAEWRTRAMVALHSVSEPTNTSAVLKTEWEKFLREFSRDGLRAEHDDQVDRECVIEAYARSAGAPGRSPPCDAKAMAAGRLVAEYLERWTNTYRRQLRVRRGRFGLPGVSEEELCDTLRLALLAALRTPAYFEDCAKPGVAASFLVMLRARDRARALKRVRLVRPEDLTVYPDDGRGSPDTALRKEADERELKDLMTRALFQMSEGERAWFFAALKSVDSDEAWSGRLNGADIARRLDRDKSTASRMLARVREILRRWGAGDFVRTDRKNEP